MREITLLVPEENVDEVIGMVAIMLKKAGCISNINNNQSISIRNDNRIDKNIYINSESESVSDEELLELLKTRGVFDDFYKPTLDDVVDYVRAKGYCDDIDANSFWCSFSAKNWIYREEPVRKWTCMCDNAVRLGFFPGHTKSKKELETEMLGRPLPKTLRSHQKNGRNKNQAR